MSTSQGGAPAVRGEVDLNKMQTDLAVLTERTGNIGAGIVSMTANLEKALATYATKEELKVVKDSIDGVKAWLTFVGKIVLGSVLVAAVGLVVAKGGVPHP